MTTRWVCKFCIQQHGLKGADLKNWPSIDDEEAQNIHIESEHHIPVRRAGETDFEAGARMVRDYPDAGGANCKCPLCVALRAVSEADGPEVDHL